MNEMLRKKENGYYSAKEYVGGDGTTTLLFTEEKERDEYVRTHDMCDSDVFIPMSELYDDGGNHYGIFVKKNGSNWVDEETGIEW